MFKKNLSFEDAFLNLMENKQNENINEINSPTQEKIINLNNKPLDKEIDPFVDYDFYQNGEKLEYLYCVLEPKVNGYRIFLKNSFNQEIEVLNTKLNENNIILKPKITVEDILRKSNDFEKKYHENELNKELNSTLMEKIVKKENFDKNDLFLNLLNELEIKTEMIQLDCELKIPDDDVLFFLKTKIKNKENFVKSLENFIFNQFLENDYEILRKCIKNFLNKILN